MSSHPFRQRRSPLVVAAIIASTILLRAQYDPGSTVPFGQQGVGTASPEKLVVKILHYPGATNTVAVNVTGQGFKRGPSSTCPTYQASINADCIVTVIFAPTSLGAKTGQVVASYGLCPGCPIHTWALTGTGVYSLCDVNRDLRINVADVQLVVNQALRIAPATSDINHDGAVNVLDVQRVVNAGLGLTCREN